MNINLEKSKLIFIVIFLCVVSVVGILAFLNLGKDNFEHSSEQKDDFEHPPELTVSDKAITFPEGVEQAFWRSHGAELIPGDVERPGAIFEIYELYTADGVGVPITSDRASVSEQNPQGETFSINSPKDSYLVKVFPPIKEGLYIFRVDTPDGKTYKANIDWRPPLSVEVDSATSPEEGYAYFEVSNLDITEPELGIFHRDPDWQISEFLPNEIIENGLLKLRLEDIRGGEHLYLFKRDGVWYQIELNYPEDF